MTEIKIPYPDQDCPKEQAHSLSLDELTSELREDAEWVGDNNYETPITLYDHLLMAAEAIDLLKALAENGESSLSTSQQLAKKVELLNKALTLACDYCEVSGGCKRTGPDDRCDHEEEYFTVKDGVCSKCMREDFLKRAEESRIAIVPPSAIPAKGPTSAANEDAIKRFKMKSGITLDDVKKLAKETKKFSVRDGGAFVEESCKYMIEYIIPGTEGSVCVYIGLPDDMTLWDDYYYVSVIDDDFGQMFTPFYSQLEHPERKAGSFLKNVVDKYNAWMSSLPFLEEI